MASAEDREKRRAKLVKRIELTLPREHRTPGVRDTLDGLAHIATWNSRGDNFEFAHFTVRQIAQAWANLDMRARQPDFDKRVALVEQMRVGRKSLDRLIGRRSKVDLAEELWPVLEQKIRRAIKRKTEDRIPIVRVLDQATELAGEWPRSGLVLSL